VNIDSEKASPIFIQIQDYIRRAVAAGVYKPGEAIPSLRAMAIKLKVNPNTVKRAYQELERAGLIKARKGVGMFVTPDGAAGAKRHAEGMVVDCFLDGIRIAHSAGIDPSRVRSLFEEASMRELPVAKEAI